MDLKEITHITQQLVEDDVLDEALLKYLEADAEIVSIGCTPVVAKIIGDTLPADHTLLKRTLLIQHGKPNTTEYVKYTRIISPHPFVDGLKITAYPPATKPSVRKLTHAEGLLLGKSDHIESVVNEILKMQQTRQSVWLLDAAMKYEAVLKRKAHLRVRSADDSDRGFALDVKTTLKAQRISAVKSSLINTLKYELEDLPLAIALKRIEVFYLLDSPKFIGKIDTEIVAKSVKIREQLASDIKKVEERTLNRLSAEVLSKPFLRKKKRKSRERAILEDHDTAVIALIEGALKALNSEAEIIKSDVIEDLLQGSEELVSELREIDPSFVDSSDLPPPSVSPQASGFTIPAQYSISSSVLERMIYFGAIGYVGEVAARFGTEEGAATVAFEAATGAVEAATTAFEVVTGAVEAVTFTVGGTTTGGTLAIGGGTLVGGGFVGSGGLLAGGTVLCEAAGVIGGMSSGGMIAGGQIGSVIPGPGTLVGTGVGLVIGTGIGVIRHHKSVKSAKESFREQAAEAREKLLKHLDTERQNLIVTNQVTVTADVSKTTSDLDSRLNELRDKIAKKIKREKRDVALLSVAALTNRLARYTEYLDHLLQD